MMPLLASKTSVLWALYIDRFPMDMLDNKKFWQTVQRCLDQSNITHFYSHKDTVPRYWYGKIWEVLRSNRNKHNYHSEEGGLYSEGGWQDQVKSDMWYPLFI